MLRRYDRRRAGCELGPRRSSGSPGLAAAVRVRVTGPGVSSSLGGRSGSRGLGAGGRAAFEAWVAGSAVYHGDARGVHNPAGLARPAHEAQWRVRQRRSVTWVLAGHPDRRASPPGGTICMVGQFSNSADDQRTCGTRCATIKAPRCSGPPLSTGPLGTKRLHRPSGVRGRLRTRVTRRCARRLCPGALDSKVGQHASPYARLRYDRLVSPPSCR